MRFKYFRRTATFVLAAATLVMPTLAVTIGGATVNTNDTGLVLRTEPSTAGSALLEIPNGAFVLVEDTLNGWYKVSYDGFDGYVASDYVRFSETQDGTYSYSASTTGTDVNLRSAASTNAGIVKCLSERGTELTVTGVCGSWLKVTDESGVSGYIRSDYVNYDYDETHTETATEAETSGAALVSIAREYIGYSYTYGGMSPSTGFDCSGFVKYIYGLYGYSLERTAQNIYNTNGAAVSKDELQAGDLLFFGYGSDSITHVGIYVGAIDGKRMMVHASTYGVGVVLSEIDGSYYSGMYVGAKRVLS